MNKQKCRSCRYGGEMSGMRTCDYLLITGRRRPRAPEGQPCPVWEDWRPKRIRMKEEPEQAGEDGPKKRGPRIKWDEQKARALVEAGLTDSEVAEAVGTSRQAINSWRLRHGVVKGEKRQDAGRIARR